MKQILKTIGQAIIMFVLIDLFILFFALAQVAVEGRTGEWNGFWAWQAKAVISILPR